MSALLQQLSPDSQAEEELAKDVAGVAYAGMCFPKFYIQHELNTTTQSAANETVWFKTTHVSLTNMLLDNSICIELRISHASKP